MKTTIFTLVTALLFVTDISFAKIWRVNNNGGIGTDFTTAQAAISSASVVNGDTIHFESSSINYGDITDLNKQLVIIGTGYFLSLGQLQANAAACKLGNILKISAPNVQVMGIEAQNIYVYKASNLQIMRCKINDYIQFYDTATNVIVKQCWIYRLYATAGTAALSNFIFANNLLAYYLTFNSNCNGTIEYNVMNLQNSSIINCGNSAFNFRYNLIPNPNVTFQNTGSTNISYCMAQANVLPAVNGNQNGVSMVGSAVFVNNDYASNNDRNFMLSGSSPALTAGPGGTPIGAYASAVPYVPSGIPPVPTIYFIGLPSSTATGNTIQVTFSTKGNN